MDESEEESLDFTLCIICQEKRSEQLVEQPNSHEKVVSFIKEWAEYGEYCKVQSKLQSFSPEDLRIKQATWHRSCYQDVAHSGMLKRAKDRYERNLEAGPKPEKRKKSNEPPTLTRSKVTPYDKNTFL